MVTSEELPGIGRLPALDKRRQSSPPSGDAVTHDVRGVALGIATLLFLVGGSIGSAAVAGLGDLVGVPGSLAILAAFPLAGIAVLAPELRRPRVVARQVVEVQRRSGA